MIGLTLALGYLVVLAMHCSGHWLFDAHGQPIANDFVDFAAGRSPARGLMTAGKTVLPPRWPAGRDDGMAAGSVFAAGRLALGGHAASAS